MSNGESPVGQRFSQVYLDRGAPLRDSPRFRGRLAAYCQHRLDEGIASLARHGLAWLGAAGYGGARRGMVRHGLLTQRSAPSREGVFRCETSQKV